MCTGTCMHTAAGLSQTARIICRLSQSFWLRECHEPMAHGHERMAHGLIALAHVIHEPEMILRQPGSTLGSPCPRLLRDLFRCPDILNISLTDPKSSRISSHMASCKIFAHTSACCRLATTFCAHRRELTFFAGHAGVG